MSYSFNNTYRSKAHAKRGIDALTSVPSAVKTLLHAAVDEMSACEDRLISLEGCGHRDHSIKVREVYLAP